MDIVEQLKMKESGQVTPLPGHQVLGIARETIERLREAARHIVSRAESVVTTDVVGNRFQKVFEADLADLRKAIGDE